MAPEALGIKRVLETELEDCPVQARSLEFGYRRGEEVGSGQSSGHSSRGSGPNNL